MITGILLIIYEHRYIEMLPAMQINENMNKKILMTIVILIGFFFSSCKNNNSENNQIGVSKEIKTKNEASIPVEEKEAIIADFAKQSVDDELADKIKNYITTKFLTEGDLRTITENQRKFQLYKIDLNNDGNKEVFVNFITSYFCGTGGCTILLLNSNLKMINKFTSTRTLFVEKTLQNDWRVLLTKSEGNWKKLIYESGSYPSNPTMVETTNEFPSGHAEIMFDENYSRPKTYNF